MMNITQINTAIIQGTFTNEQLTSVLDAVKFAKTLLGTKNKMMLRLGDNVNFTSSKTGQNVTGVVTKIAIKYVTVKTASGLWRVPANMLAKIDEPEFA
jgi:small-conductance mechanosensitive channel